MEEISAVWSHSLTKDEIRRYGRHLILRNFGLKAQEKLCASSVLVVGAGGIGCPVAMYLAGAGVGKICIVDDDVVEISNLHRQVAHQQSRLGVNKAESLAASCRSLNPSVTVLALGVRLTSANALATVRGFDLVCDCTDNVASRYLVSDACVLAHRPLVSASALGWDAQLCVLHFRGGPCYRCLFPQPPPPVSVQRCSDHGVLGVVPGIIGSLQALEAVKILVDCKEAPGDMVLFEGFTGRFKHIRLRGRNASCAVCGDEPTQMGLENYDESRAMCATDQPAKQLVLGDAERITIHRLAEKQPGSFVLVDCRPSAELDIYSLKNSCHLPWPDIKTYSQQQLLDQLKSPDPGKEIFVICRRGNDSQEAVEHLRKVLGRSNIFDVVGGTEAWNQVDIAFPFY